MKQLITYNPFISLIVLMIFIPVLSKAQPPGPGGDPFADPYATPVNGGVAFVAAIAFAYGAYRIYQLAKKNRVDNSNR